MPATPWVVVTVADGEDAERVLERWWFSAVAAAATALPADALTLDWRDLPAHRVSPYVVEAWRAAPLDALARRYRARDAVLLYGRRARELVVYGVVRLFAAAAVVTVGDALVARTWLAASERRPGAPLPSLVVLTLETAAVLGEPEEFLATQTLDPATEEPRWFRAAVDTLLDLVHGRTPREAVLSRWGFSAAEQFRAAKMRYCVKLCLLQAPATLEAHREALALGVRALASWTEAMVAALAATSEHRAVEFVRRFRLPLRSRVLPMPESLSSSSGGGGGVSSLPLPFADSSQLALAYGRVRTTVPEADDLGRANVAASVVLASGARVIGARAEIPAPVLYVPALPTAFFVHLLRGRATPTRDALFSSLVAFLRELGACPARLTVTYAPPLFAVRELIWPNGGDALRSFAVEWAAHAGVEIDDAVYTQRGALEVPRHPVTWVPHPHVASLALLPKGDPVPPSTGGVPRPRAVEACGGDEPSVVFCPVLDGDEEHLLFSDLPRWIGARVRADVEACRASTFSAYARDLSILTLGRALMRHMGSSLCARLQAVVTLPRVSTLASSGGGGTAGDGAFSSPDYRRIEHEVGDRPAYAEAFFRALMHGATVRAEGIRLRADGHLTFVVRGQFALCWKDWRLGATGRGLGSLVRHHLGELDAAGALEWILRWYGEYTTPRAGAASSAAAMDEDHRPRTPRRLARAAPKDISADRDKVNRMIRSMTLAEPETTAARYLRERRGLSDAPTALIEANRSFRAGRNVVFRFDDGRPSVKVDVLACVTTQGYAVQMIYLDRLTVDKSAAVSVKKRTHGAISIAADRKDAVRIWHPPADEPVTVVILAEGPETALSVADAFHAHAGVAVYTSLSVYNMADFHCDSASPRATTLVMCRENDSRADVRASIDATLRAATAVLEHRFARVVHVWPPSDTYGDFNDVHQRHPGAEGTAIIRAHLESAVPELRATPVSAMAS